MDAVGGASLTQLAATQALLSTLGPPAPIAALAERIATDPQKQLALAQTASPSAGVVDVYA